VSILSEDQPHKLGEIVSYPLFKNIDLWTEVRALKKIKTKNRTMKAGETGVVVRRWAYMIEVRPDGKKLPVEVTDESFLEIIN